MSNTPLPENSIPSRSSTPDASARDGQGAVWKGGSEAARHPALRDLGLPSFLARGKGSQVWDPQGRGYVDYLMAWGSALLGHCHPIVEARVRQQLDRGALFNLPVVDEVRLAERLVGHIPGAEALRFVASGSEATQAAVRIARAATGRGTIVRCGYHGWLDWCQAEHPAGILPENLARTKTLPYNDLDGLRRLFAAQPGEVAAVVMEPIKAELPRDGYLEGLRECVQSHGALLVFDEVKTGFRFGLGGAQAHFGVTPDICTFGKALANGYPLAVVAAKAEVLERADEVWISGTYHGWPPALAAALATLDVLEAEPVVERIWRAGARLIAGFEALEGRTGAGVLVRGAPPMPVLASTPGREAQVRRFCRGMAARGYFIHPLRPLFIAQSHDDETVEQTLRDASAVLHSIRESA